MSRYDRNNELFGVNINGTEYIYLKNMQGDIEGILDMAGSLMVSYAYDAWGRVLSVTGTLADTIGQLNPMRYRGYYLDSETGYYYLQSRYYNPDWCRFINADEPSILPLNYGSVIGANLFAYCENNPVMHIDPNGHLTIKLGNWVIWAIDIAIIIIPAIYSINQILKRGRVAVSTLSKVSSALAKVVAKALTKKLGKRGALALTTAIQAFGKLASIFVKVSIGYLVEYLVDCLDGKRDHKLNTNANLKFRIIR